MSLKRGPSEEAATILQQLGWVKVTSITKDQRPIQEFSHILTLQDIQSTLSCKQDGRFLDNPLDISDLADELNSTARPKSKRRPKTPSTVLSSRPVQLSATETAKMAMTVQEPQLLDKMENVAYRLTAQADERKKHMQSRGVFGEDQNALRARSVQRVQLWKGLHPSALSEAVSHFTMSQKLQNKSSSTRSATLQGRTEKACLDVLSRLDADLPLSAIQGTLDAHASGKLSGAKLDSAITGITAEYAAKAKSRILSPEQESSLRLNVATAQAKRLQQYQDKIAQESEAVLARAQAQSAQSSPELLVNQLSEEGAESKEEAREEERAHLTASGPALLEAVLARIKAAEDRLAATRHQRAGTKGAGLRAAGALITTASYLSEEDSAGSLPEPSTFALSPKAASQARMGVDYEYGKVFGKQDADKYFGGMLGMRTKSGHAKFQGAPAKSWESGQRPRNLRPHEMPWARAGSCSVSLSPQKSIVQSLGPSVSSLASLTSDASLDAAILAEEEAKREEEARRAAAASIQVDSKPAASILDEAWGGVITLPTKAEISAVPMPELPNLEPPSPRKQFETIAQFLQIRLERVWGILQMPVTTKLDWVIRYTGEEGSDLFEPALQAWEQAAAAVLERERLLGQLSQVQQQLVQPAWLPSFSAGQAQGAKSLADHVDRLSICFVIATVQVEAAANLLQEVFGEHLLYQGVLYPGAQALTLTQLEQFVARVHACNI